MDFSNIRIVLVETSHSGNIGAAARAMLNMGLTRLVLVKPRVWPSQEAVSMAVSAHGVLDAAVVVDTLQDAIAGCHVVFGTSARLRTMPVQLLPPEDCAQRVVEAGPQQQIAIVFGREAAGLTNEELHLCHYHVHIPVNPEYSSLNLAAAVMVLCYELRKAALRAIDAKVAPTREDAVPTATPDQEWDQEPATADELERYLQHLEQVLIRLDFHKPEYKRPLMRRLRRLYQRIQPDKMEINILRGILTATEQAIDGRKSGGQPRKMDE
jgi:tRNA (cytidine32/uridine32-2'-O)-methyltransferase